MLVPITWWNFSSSFLIRGNLTKACITFSIMYFSSGWSLTVLGSPWPLGENSEHFGVLNQLLVRHASTATACTGWSCPSFNVSKKKRETPGQSKEDFLDTRKPCQVWWDLARGGPEREGKEEVTPAGAACSQLRCPLTEPAAASRGLITSSPQHQLQLPDQYCGMLNKKKFLQNFLAAPLRRSIRNSYCLQLADKSQPRSASATWCLARQEHESLCEPQVRPPGWQMVVLSPAQLTRVEPNTGIDLPSSPELCTCVQTLWITAVLILLIRWFALFQGTEQVRQQ